MGGDAMQDWGGDAVMTLEEAAAFLKISETLIYQLLREGELKARKVGREWRFLKSNLVAYLREGADMNETSVLPDEVNGGEYRLENGREMVALWLPMTREQKKRLIAEVMKKNTTVTDVTMNALRPYGALEDA
jgi:excisionase family DNA binding protein